jgi:GDP dissociation inhibitor
MFGFYAIALFALWPLFIVFLTLYTDISFALHHSPGHYHLFLCHEQPSFDWLPAGMEALADGEYDAIVMGTGLKECVISGLLSVQGKRVLQVDRNGYYGGDGASLNLTTLFEKFQAGEPPANLGANRDYNIDLIPKVRILYIYSTRCIMKIMTIFFGISPRQQLT